LVVLVRFRKIVLSSLRFPRRRQSRFSERPSVVTRDEIAATKEFVKALIRRLRMEYGSSMAMKGIDPDVIIAVQQEVAQGMLDWLAE
jgi:hypothetical protein